MPEVKLNGKRKAEPTHEASAECACTLCLARRRKNQRSGIKAENFFFESAERNGIRSFHSLNGKPTKLLFYAIQHSARVRMPFRAKARMSFIAIK